MYATPEHTLGNRIMELADQAVARGDLYAMAAETLPDGRRAVVKVYRPDPKRAGDPKAP